MDFFCSDFKLTIFVKAKNNVSHTYTGPRSLNNAKPPRNTCFLRKNISEGTDWMHVFNSARFCCCFDKWPIIHHHVLFFYSTSPLRHDFTVCQRSSLRSSLWKRPGAPLIRSITFEILREESYGTENFRKKIRKFGRISWGKLAQPD